MALDYDLPKTVPTTIPALELLSFELVSVCTCMLPALLTNAATVSALLRWQG
jgi:hypothetical protein